MSLSYSYYDLLNSINYFYSKTNAVNVNKSALLESWLSSNSNLSEDEIYTRLATDMQSSLDTMRRIRGLGDTGKKVSI